MGEFIAMLFNGTQIMFNQNTKTLTNTKTIDTKKEIRLAKARMKHSVLHRSSNRIKNIATEALS